MLTRIFTIKKLLLVCLICALTGWSCAHSTHSVTGDEQEPLVSAVPAPPTEHMRIPMAIAPEDTISIAEPVQPLSVEEAQQLFQLPPGYKIEPVLTEPIIREPAAIAFDGNGRMFVLELRTYMQDIDATDELTPISRISMHEDTDNDGAYDKHHIFVDSLIFPRFVLPFGGNGVITMESNVDEVYLFTDTDGDGSADHKELFETDYGRPGNVEHQQSFLTWGMDNWMYSTYNLFRIRWTPEGMLREPTGVNRSQWGVTQDNDGKLWFQGGASGLPGYFQLPIVYGNFDVEEPFAEGFEVPYGIAGFGDYQPGPNHSRPDGTLNRVTGAAGSDIYRGNALPADMIGHYIYGEPVARVVRRVEPVVTEGLTQLHNVYQDEESEFIKTIDPLFRPVDMATAPDGSLYIVDMYRGIIQQGNWTAPGSFLRAKIKQYGFDDVFGNGRIWRVTYEGMGRDMQQPRMLDETPAQWVEHLAHPNGWWRDAAQQLLVQRQDKSVTPALETMARSHENIYARYHALWSLEGLSALDADLLRTLLDDEDAGVRIQALRASETLYKAGDTSLASDYEQLAVDPDENVAIQAMLTMDVLQAPTLNASIQKALASSDAAGVQFVGEQLIKDAEGTLLGFPTWGLSDQEIKRLESGASTYASLCSQCHGANGAGAPLGEGRLMAPSLANAERVKGHPDYIIKTLLHGLSGPIEEVSYPGDLMVGMGENSDEWIAAVASYVRRGFANDATLVTPSDVAAVRANSSDRSSPYRYEELLSEVPTILEYDRDTWVVSASHAGANRVGGTFSAAGALTYEGWTSGAMQEPGMWFQVELPEAKTLVQMHFFSQPVYRGWGPDAKPPIPTYPHTYEIHVSTDGMNWGEPIATGHGSANQMKISFDAVEAKFVRITQTSSAGDAEPGPWNMRSLQLLGL